MSRQVKKVNISGKEDKSNKVTSWSNTTTDAHYPSEKLVKDSLDGKANSTHNHTKSQITDFPTSMTPSSHTHGNLQNNGQVGSTAQASKNVVTDSSGKITTEDKPTIPSASSTTPSADTTNGSVGTGTTWARSNHTHPKSSLYAEATHNHTKSQITDFPSIPSKTSDLQNDSGFLTSHQDISGKIDTAGTGLSKSGTTLNHSNSITALTTASFKKVKYDSQGHITGTSDVSASDLPTHTHSQYLTSHQDISGKEDSSNKVSSWSSTTNNIRYPTEKLVKDSLDGKADNNHTHEVLLSSNDDSDIQLFNVSAQGIPQGEGQSLGAFLLEFWKKIYPIGSIYMNVNNVDPAILFGGQWEQIEDMFLLASGSTYENGTTGGSADATLVSHQHGTSYTGEYFVTSESSEANNTRVTFSSSGNRYVDGMTASTTPFHHRMGTGYVGSSATGKNMPPYLAVNVWKRIA